MCAQITDFDLWFQCILTSLALYLAMLVTNWGHPALFMSQISFLEDNNTCYWYQLFVLFVSMLVYTFSMVGPLLCKNR